MALALSRSSAHEPQISYRKPLGRYTPTKVNDHTRWRFFRHRREELLHRCGVDVPDQRLALAIEKLAKAEWDAHAADC